MWGLVLSRLLFNAHVVVPTAKYSKTLNSVYMRVLRRISDDCSFGEKTIRDIDVRKKLQAPSIDCLLMRGRLRYLARIVKATPRALLALLFAAPKGKQMPWYSPIIEDIRTLKCRVGLCGPLPDPKVESRKWVDFMIQNPEKWSPAVSALHFVESQCDSHVQSVTGSPALHCRCDVCSASFASSKTLQSHQRVKHGHRVPQRFYCDLNGMCPVGKTYFNTRLRLLAYLSDKRRDKCWSQIISNTDLYPALPQNRVEELDASDKQARATARKDGHSHPIAVGCARTVQGARRWPRSALKLPRGPSSGAQLERDIYCCCSHYVTCSLHDLRRICNPWRINK